ncbi:NADH dehydrogenase [ubiquinone] 1 beta subcomplex subunit 8, mitochondrial [Orchesella cincta]|uniref:NADH dehydrogenase [ubiquinone] 1 beta subcomplex subunit 8, mitochondrial n=1 Tax=Orchesella cincta TaxID=48709 RepID=A0A1D2NKZ3_ORCCI|nr:NADH dehydrogenase [ubiquinone] 1 beta subcomplex subunit 8, mitochondrial [Orchesella cincta]
MPLPMLIARRVGPRALVQHARAISSSAVNSAGYWNKDWRPADDPPATEEAKRAAAKKYGMIPEDYETYKNDGTGYGDYPKLPIVSAESRDPHALYDFPELKRNFGEPLHVDADMYGEDRWDRSKRLRIPYHVMLTWFLGVIGITATLFMLSEYVRVNPTRRMPKPLYNDGKKHYTFELEDVE